MIHCKISLVPVLMLCCVSEPAEYSRSVLNYLKNSLQLFKLSKLGENNIYKKN
jgi:hypothetical protein